MSTFAPIALFVYRRLEHTVETIEALKKNFGANRSDLIIFSDGPKDDAAAMQVAEVRKYIRQVSGFRTVTVTERSENKGLANSIISGVAEVLLSHEQVIVVEDDLITSPYFLMYMNDGLQKYVTDDRVASIHGYVYPVSHALPETFFLRGADCWGWATWRRGWNLFNPDGAELLKQLEDQELTHAFDLDGAFQYTEMLRNQILGVNDSWAIRWHASAFLANTLTLYPGRSLVYNTGVDGSGTHCTTNASYDVGLSPTKIEVGAITVEESVVARNAFKEFGLRNSKPLHTYWGLRSLFRRLVGNH